MVSEKTHMHLCLNLLVTIGHGIVNGSSVYSSFHPLMTHCDVRHIGNEIDAAALTEDSNSARS